MDNHPRIQLKVGVFVVLGLVLIVLSIFALGAGRSLVVSSVTLHSHFDNVAGLYEGGVVSLSGINIGNVSKIEFLTQENKLDVQMLVEASYLSRITEGSSVEIRTQGALGDKYVYISPGDRNLPSVKPNAILAVSKSGDIMSMVSERGAEAGQIFDIISEVHKTLKIINDDNRAEKIMSNFAEASFSLKLTALESHKLILEMRTQDSPKLKSSLERLDSILTKVDKGEGSLGALINDSSIHDQLKGMLGGSSQKKIMKSLIRTSIEKE